MAYDSMDRPARRETRTPTRSARTGYPTTAQSSGASTRISAGCRALEARGGHALGVLQQRVRPAVDVVRPDTGPEPRHTVRPLRVGHRDRGLERTVHGVGAVRVDEDHAIQL